MTAIVTTTAMVPLVALCAALSAPRSTVYRRRRPPTTPKPRPTPKRALSQAERQAVLDELHSERFVDRAPAEVVHTLLAEGKYLASERTMYRVLDDNDEVKERRAQRVHPEYTRPELVATAPNEVWSWDITRLRTPVKWAYLYLYVVMDIFSRAVVGWLVADKENAALARRLIEETVAKEGVRPGTLVLHADRGTQMTSKTLAQLLADLDVERSFSRPQVSNDNPFSESMFKTVKYHPSFPGKFANVDDVVAFCRTFFSWYNDEHRHSGVEYLTPGEVHAGRADEALAHRHAVKMAAWEAHPERFPRGAPRRETLAPAVYINPPLAGAATTDGLRSAAAQQKHPPESPPPSPSPSPQKTERSGVWTTVTGMAAASPDSESEPSLIEVVH
jgi:putative transposase